MASKYVRRLWIRVRRADRLNLISFGAPMVTLLVGSFYGLQFFTRVRFEKDSTISHDEHGKYSKSNPAAPIFDLEAETKRTYEQLAQQLGGSLENWENKRIERPPELYNNDSDDDDK